LNEPLNQISGARHYSMLKLSKISKTQSIVWLMQQLSFLYVNLCLFW